MFFCVYLRSCLCILHIKLFIKQVCVLDLSQLCAVVSEQFYGKVPTALCGGQNSKTVPKFLALVYTHISSQVFHQTLIELLL